MGYWLLKTEPGDYAWADLVKKGTKGDVWTGVRNHQAKSNLVKMKKGDHAFFYHTGDEKQVVGIAEVVRESYPDPTDSSGLFAVVDVKATSPVPKPVTLAAIKAEPRLREMVLVNNARLSVQPVTKAEWDIVCRMGGMKAAG